MGFVGSGFGAARKNRRECGRFVDVRTPPHGTLLSVLRPLAAGLSSCSCDWREWWSAEGGKLLEGWVEVVLTADGADARLGCRGVMGWERNLVAGRVAAVFCRTRVRVQRSTPARACAPVGLCRPLAASQPVSDQPPRRMEPTNQHGERALRLDASTGPGRAKAESGAVRRSKPTAGKRTASPP